MYDKLKFINPLHLAINYESMYCTVQVLSSCAFPHTFGVTIIRKYHQRLLLLLFLLSQNNSKVLIPRWQRTTVLYVY